MPRPFESQITFLATLDLPATAEFYERALGLAVALDQGSCRIYRTGGGGFIGFCIGKGPARPEGIIITLVTEDVDGWYEALKEKGVTFDQPPTSNPEYQIYHCFLRDPNGYIVEIQRFDDPRWQPAGGLQG